MPNGHCINQPIADPATQELRRRSEGANQAFLNQTFRQKTGRIGLLVNREEFAMIQRISVVATKLT